LSPQEESLKKWVGRRESVLVKGEGKKIQNGVLVESHSKKGGRRESLESEKKAEQEGKGRRGRKGM